jgi:hypothetical protein
MFKEDTKTFYRNLSTKNMDARKPLCMAQVKPYWESLWGEKAQHNERAEWIRRERRRKISNMDWVLVRTMGISFVKNSQLEVINYKITIKSTPSYPQTYYKQEKQCTYERNVEELLRKYCCCEKAVSITYYECVCM